MNNLELLNKIKKSFKITIILTIFMSVCGFIWELFILGLTFVVICAEGRRGDEFGPLCIIFGVLAFISFIIMLCSLTLSIIGSTTKDPEKVYSTKKLLTLARVGLILKGTIMIIEPIIAVVGSIIWRN